MVVNRKGNVKADSPESMNVKKSLSQRERKKKKEKVSELEIAEENILKELQKWKAAIEINKKMQVEYLSQAEQEKAYRDQLKEEIDGLRTVALESKDKRDEINQKVSELKEKRNSANKQVVELKKKRDSLYEHVRNRKDELKGVLVTKRELKEQLKESSKERRGVRDLERKINSIEWYHQTNVISWEEEKHLMDRVANLYRELSTLRGDQKNVELESKHKQLSDELRENFENIDEIRNEASRHHQLMVEEVTKSEQYHNEILSLVKNSEGFHKKMIENFEKINQLRKQQEKAHETYVRSLREWDFLKKGIDPALEEIDHLNERLARVRYGMLRRRRYQERGVMDEKTQNAMKKYKVGEKLTFEEFKILLDRGLISRKDF